MTIMFKPNLILLTILLSVLTSCRFYTYIQPQKSMKESLKEKRAKEQQRKLCEEKHDNCPIQYYVY